MFPEAEQLNILRRIAERGRSLAEDHMEAEAGAECLDLWIRMLDEIARLRLILVQEDSKCQKQ